MSEIRDAVAGLLGGLDPRAGDRDEDDASVQRAFAKLTTEGWTRVGLAEELGGNGGTLVDAAEVAGASAYLGVATPLADQVLIANTAAGLLGIPLPESATCVMPMIADGGRAARVPWASWASHLLVADRSGGVALVSADDIRLTPGANLAGLPSDTVSLPGRVAGPGGAVAADLLLHLGALARSAQMAASLRRCQDLCVTYTRQRRQFGRALADMPVVQQELAALAGEAAAAEAASRAAVEAVAASTAPAAAGSPAARAIAAAKVRAGLAATAGARSAHQLHGAIGITQEYELHLHTLSLWAWRDEYDSERAWSQRLGRAVGAAPEGLWAGLVPSSDVHPT
jgi:acyl-CoA dehydrogenase